jgi:hypothetical protein
LIPGFFEEMGRTSGDVYVVGGTAINHVGAPDNRIHLVEDQCPNAPGQRHVPGTWTRGRFPPTDKNSTTSTTGCLPFYWFLPNAEIGRQVPFRFQSSCPSRNGNWCSSSRRTADSNRRHICNISRIRIRRPTPKSGARCRFWMGTDLKWFQNLPSGSRPRRSVAFNRRNTCSILRIERHAPTPGLGPRGGFEATFRFCNPH